MKTKDKGDYFFSTKQLTVGYNNQPLIKDIEIRLNRGEILTLIGPNGSGKSTILKSITKYLKSIYGTVYIDGDSIEDMTGKEMAHKVAVVLTEKPSTELMTCEDVVATGRYPYTGLLGILSDADRAEVKAAMELVNAWDLRDQDFTRISDGQRQRILLARAICQQPQIIVLDEPTSFLDIHFKLELLGILRSMAEERQIAVILSLHELDMAQKVSDTVMCVKGEVISHYGAPEEIFTKEHIHDLYELTNGAYNPLFGSLEMQRPQGEAKVFVIAGGGGGIPVYRELQKKGTPFVTGVLHENDIDYQVAVDLAAEVISERAFAPISGAVYDRAVKRLKGCDTVLNCLAGYGEMNAKNAQLLGEAEKLGISIVNQFPDQG